MHAHIYNKYKHSIIEVAHKAINKYQNIILENFMNAQNWENTEKTDACLITEWHILYG